MFTSSIHASQSNPNYSPQNGHQPNHIQPNGLIHPNQPPQSQRSNASTQPKETVSVIGIPSVSIHNGRLVVGDARTTSHRSYTPIKTLGDGSFGTVLLCDWHGTLPPNTPLSPMQCGGGARPEWAGKRLVAVKRMKKKWEGGWDECKRLKELESLRAIPFHPCIIPLYDFFLLPDTKELYFVFESMEGNLYHLIKTRRGRPLAGGLVANIFRQIVSGLHHIHASGYFHRDMKPENVLVTTTGIFDYRSLSPLAPPNAPPEKDVVAIIKLADFGLARETLSAPPYTEYVSTRWYRAPEVLLMSRDYSNPVDMWALGTIMAELVNLRPLFPGSGQLDQIARICEVLGDPTEDYGPDARGKPCGGGKWNRGVKMAKQVGFTFPKMRPRDFLSYFDRTVPRKLIECISDLLKYDPNLRLTSRDCWEHPYLEESLLDNIPPMPPALHVQTLPSTPSKSLTNGMTLLTPSASPRSFAASNPHNALPKSPYHQPPNLHPGHFPDASSSHRSPFAPSNGTSATHTPASHKTSEFTNDLRIHTHQSGIQEEMRTNGNIWGNNQHRNNSDQMEVSSPQEAPPYDYEPGQAMDIQSSQMAQDYSARPRIEHDQPMQEPNVPSHGTKLGKLSSLGFGKKHTKWSLGMFGHRENGHHQSLPPVDEVPGASSSSNPSLKRTQSTSSDSPSVADSSPANGTARKDPKAIKKEAERLQREAEKQRRAHAERAQREQARAVIQKRNQIFMQSAAKNELEWKWQHSGSLLNVNQRLVYEDSEKGKRASASGPIRQNQAHSIPKISSPTLSAASGRYINPVDGTLAPSDRWKDERLSKARRRDFDDDHSMSSSDIHSAGHTSVISFATVDSDPGPSRMRNRPSVYGINRMTSASSLRTATTSFDDFPTSARSSNSISLDHQFLNDFNIRASVDTTSSVSGTSSPPPINLLSLSPSPNSWMHAQSSRESASPPYMVPPLIQYPPSSHKSYECNGQMYGHPPSPGMDSQSVINPIFKVPPLPSPATSDSLSSPHSLPPFSHLEAVAEGEYPPLSPMSFHSPEDD
ncbi:Pkinase-domain-containing protein [Hygrophoropsis aurantiaca]|uniref:Pkinase-domain-containing protein n=1 Tax=Hygrophoropsis aurantiaca TaxID=72124 RepID=A0ACB8ACC1_9AGAM|nr:Pkinase-domain-containing protein [Hygrophoropsis aurantiaca]